MSKTANKKVYNYQNPRPRPSSVDMGKSCTVPEQTLTLRTLIDRYKRGMPLEGRIKQGQYHDGEFPDLSNLDLSEIAALKRAAQEQVNEMQRDLQQQEQQRIIDERKKLEAEIEALKGKLASADMGTTRSDKNVQSPL